MAPDIGSEIYSPPPRPSARPPRPSSRPRRRWGGGAAAAKWKGTENVISTVSALDEVVGIVLVIVGYNPSVVCSSSCASIKGAVVVVTGSSMGTTAKSLSNARAGREAGCDLGLPFGLGFGFVLGLGLGLGFSMGFGFGFRILWFWVVVIWRLALLGGTLPVLPVPLFGGAAACCRRRLFCRRLHEVNLWWGDEEMVRYCAIVVDCRQINDTLNRFLEPGERHFENLAL